MQPWQAVVLGAVEGVTEFLPVSSTGHLIVTSRLLGLASQAVNTFEVVIQAGAMAAVAALYRARLSAMWRGLWGHDPVGRRLCVNVLVSFMPAAVVGLALHDAIKTRLFGVRPVVWALALGGIVMIVVDAATRQRAGNARGSIESLRRPRALAIGLAQCLSLWPGTSRAMVTIVAGLLIGLSPAAAAEYSFLLAIPTLAAATLLDALKGGGKLISQVGIAAVGIGFLTAAVVAAVAVNGFLRYLTRHGLSLFGWYRLALAAAVYWLVPRG